VAKNIASKSFGALPRNSSKPTESLRQTQSYKTVKTTNSNNKVKTVPASKRLTNNKPVCPRGQKTVQSNKGDKLGSSTTKKEFKTSNKYKHIKASSSVVAYKKDLQKNKTKIHSKSDGVIDVRKLQPPKKLESKSVGTMAAKKTTNARELKSKVSIAAKSKGTVTAKTGTVGTKPVNSNVPTRQSVQPIKATGNVVLVKFVYFVLKKNVFWMEIANF